MPIENQSTFKSYLPYLVLGVFILLLGYFAWWKPSNTTTELGCTMEAKVCPDGSSVGRSGPACEFAKCPSEEGNKTFNDPKNGVTFYYPETLAAKYISLVDWPPALSIAEGEFTCTQSGSETDRTGATKRQVINGHNYCVTKVTEGAAGSTYTQHAYAFSKDGKVATLTFSLRFSQCGNYDEAERNACETERATFSMDNIIDNIAQSLVIDWSVKWDPSIKK